MHFFTQAAPLPVCLAPHMASEIQPLMVESAARAESGAKARTAVRTAATRFTRTLQEMAVSRSASIIHYRKRFGKCFKLLIFWCDKKSGVGFLRGGHASLPRGHRLARHLVTLRRGGKPADQLRRLHQETRILRPDLIQNRSELVQQK